MQGRTRTGILSCCLAVFLTGCPTAPSPVQRALTFLSTTQTTAADEQRLGQGKRMDYEGNWPQVFYFRHFQPLRIPEVSPFVVAFVYHSLAQVNEDTADALGLSQADVDDARLMRKRAMECLLRFESDPAAPDAGTFGFWPYDPDPAATNTPVQEAILDIFQGPILTGNRTPLNFDFFPHELAIPADADVTATTYAAMLDDFQLDGGPGASVAFEQFFADWRDTGVVPRRLDPEWLPDATGAFFTWLMYKDPPDDTVPNDIDLVVNANVLHALARYGKTSTPGFDEAVALINDAVQQGLHRDQWRDISDYYPQSYVFHYCVARAYREGPVPGLAPAVDILADDLEDEAIQRPDGTVFWDLGDPHLNTAFALLTLLNAGRDTDLVEKGVEYLLREQDPARGCWDEGVFFVAHLYGGQEVHWASSALTTAFVLEALCQYQLTQ
ncbi:MAG: hypothetical protein IT365_19925 [Candidatus Hydrogenedentes bacterium]|nr:hypothetical protein [Candidatus Hydrogenedentota bacterium]